MISNKMSEFSILSMNDGKLRLRGNFTGWKILSTKNHHASFIAGNPIPSLMGGSLELQQQLITRRRALVQPVDAEDCPVIYGKNSSGCQFDERNFCMDVVKNSNMKL